MVNFKSSATLVGELKNFLRMYASSLDTGDNSILKEFILDPQSVGGEIIYEQLRLLQNLFYLSQTSGTDLAIVATNYKLERSGGHHASVDLIFYSSIAPSGQLTIPANTRVSTAGSSFSSPVTFYTLADFIVPAGNFDPYYSYDRGRYEFEVSAVANDPGSASNVGASTISSILDPIAEVTGVTNLNASTGGLDQESDEDLRKRISLVMTGRDINTVSGARSFVTSFGFQDSYGVRVEDADSERATGVDVFVIDDTLATQTDVFTYYPSAPRHHFSKKPVDAVTSVQASTLGYLSSADYDVHTDSSTPMRRSANAYEYMDIKLSASLPPGTPVTVTYTYNPAIDTLQQSLLLEDNQVLTADMLVKRAYPLYFYLTASLTLKVNADGPSVRAQVRNALSQFLGTYRLGDDLQKSDVTIILQTGYGDYPVTDVDAVSISQYYLTDEFGTNYTPTNEVIAVDNKHYVVYGNVILT